MCVSVCNVLSVYEGDSVCVHRSVMSRVMFHGNHINIIIRYCICDPGAQNQS